MPATLTSWSKPQAMKSENCISQTGRRPAIAAPTAVPMMAASAIGVSRTRSAPNSLLQAVGHLEGAAEGADVLAHDEDAFVLGHRLTQRLSVIACR